MKHILPLLIALLLTMAGCHRPATTGELCTELQQAEALMYPHPDSALHILQAMNVPGDELNRATWALFTTQAKYKLYQTQSDSLINIALPYFLKTEDTQRRALALYYRAALYNEEKKVEEAQDFYLKAAEEVEKTEDYQLAHLIYAECGKLYLGHIYPEYAEEYFNKALHYAILSNNHYYISSAYHYLAMANRITKQIDKAINYYKEAIKSAENIVDSNVTANCYNELASIYKGKGDFQTALRYALKGLNNKKEMIEKGNAKGLDYYNSYVVIGQIYHQLHKNDSAFFFLNKATASENTATKCLAFSILYKLSAETKSIERMISYGDSIWYYQDLFFKEARKQELAEMQEKYDQQKVKDEAAMEIRLQKQRTQMYIGIIIVVVLLAGVYARHRYRQRIARLAEAEDRIDTLTRMIEEAQASTDKEDAFVKRMLLQQLGVIRLVASTPTAQNQALLRRLAELGNDQVPVEELIVWEDLYPLIDRLYNGFHSRLKERFGSLLTDKEVQTCCLLCAGFSTKEIGVITHQSASSIYVRKTAIRKKLGAEEGADIVEVVKNLP